MRFGGWDSSGEPMGQPVATPHIQVTACSEDQTQNTWRALQPMIELGPLANWIPDSGLTRINLPGGGLVEPVTAAARSRLGQRATFVVQDQTESWVPANHGPALADAQRRNLAGMGGRFLETCNAYDPNEQSVAERTQSEPGVLIDDVDGGAGSIRNKQERRRVMSKVYGDSVRSRGGWVDLDRIDAEIEALVKHDPAQAERWFLNRKLVMEGAAFDPEVWASRAGPKVRPGPREAITIGVDGARFRDALAAVATHVKTGYQWPLFILERPDGAPEDYEHDLAEHGEADAPMEQAFERWLVWRVYCDDQYIRPLVDRWQARWGTKRVVIWHTNRPRPIAWAVRGFEDAVAGEDFHHDGDEVYARHVRHARKRLLNVFDDEEHQMHTLTKDSVNSPRKIDAAMAGVLSWQARNDAVAMGAVQVAPSAASRQTPRPKGIESGVAPPAWALSGPADQGPGSI